MTNLDYDLLVIGSGPGGQEAAITAAKLGKRVAIIERKPYVGGVSLQTGTIPSKALREAAYVTSRTASLGMRRTIQSRAASEPGFLIDALGQKDRVVNRKEAQLLERLMSEGVMLIPGEACFINAHTLQVTGPRGDRQCLSAAFIVLATGSRPRRPASVPFDKERVLDSTSLLKIRHLPASLIIVGGGVIACEFATIFASLGSKVTLLEMMKILPKDDPELVAVVRASLEADGVVIREGAKVVAAASGDGGVAITVESQAEEGKGGEVIKGTHLLVAAGRKVTTDGLELDKGGIDHDRRGIKVDDCQRSLSNRKVYAVGDVGGNPQFTHMAGYGGGLFIRDFLFRLPGRVSLTAFPWVTYCDPELAHVGMTEAMAKEKGEAHEILRHSQRPEDRQAGHHDRPLSYLWRGQQTHRGLLLHAQALFRADQGAGALPA